MASIFAQSGGTGAPRRSGSIFDQSGSQSEGDDRPGFMETLRAVPGEAARLAGNIWEHGSMGVPIHQAQNIGPASRGDREAAIRRDATGLMLSSLAGAVIPGGSGFAARAALGALGGGLTGGLEAAATQRPVLPAAGFGAAGGAILNPLVGGIGDKLERWAASRLNPGQIISEAAEVGAEPIANAAARKRIAITQRTGSPERTQAVVQAQRSGVLDREERLQIATAITGRKVRSFNELSPGEAQQVADYFAAQVGPAKGPATANLMAQSSKQFVNAINNPPPTTPPVAAGGAGGAVPPGGVANEMSDAALRWHAAVTNGLSFFRTLGDTGNRFADMMESVRAKAFPRVATEGGVIERLQKDFTDAEAEKIFDIWDGAPSNDPKLVQAANMVKGLIDQHRYEALGLAPRDANGVPFGPMAELGTKTGAPKIITDRSVMTAPTGQRNYLRRMGGPSINRMGAWFEPAVPPASGYERNAFKVAAMYIEKVAPRVAQADMFGANDQGARAMLEDIANTHGKAAAKQAGEVYGAWVDPMGQEYSKTAAIAREAAVPLFLTNSGIVQPAQMGNTVAREGVINTFKGIHQALTNPAARRQAELAGAAQISALDDMIHRGGISDRWSRLIGLRKFDRFNRLASGMAAQFRAQDVARELAAGKMNRATLLDAKRLGIDVTQLARNNWQLTPQQTREAMFRGAASTQFLSDALSSPLNRNKYWWGPLVYMFKNFGMNQSKFVKDLVLDGVRHGHWAPAIRYAGATAVTAATVGELIGKLKGNERPDDPAVRMIENVMNVGALGMFGTLLQNIASGDVSQVTSTLAGPVVSEATGVVTDLGQAGQGNMDPLTRRLLRRTVKRVPVVGSQLYEEYAP